MRASLRRLLSTVGASLLLTTLVAGTPATAEPTDTTPPVLRSVSVAPGPYVPGQTVTWTFDIQDASPIKGIDVLYATAEATPRRFGTGLIVPAGWRTGQLTWTIPGTPTTAPYDGAYEVTQFWVRDSAGNSARYYTDGRLFTVPATQTTHTVDTRAPLSIVNSPRDVTPPRLTAFAPPASLDYGLVRIPYTVQDATQVRVTVFGRRDGGEEMTLHDEIDAPKSGTLAFYPPGIGVLDLTRVRIGDSNGQAAMYASDGSVTTIPAGPPTSHSFSIGRIAVLPSPAESLSVYPSSGAATIMWSQLPIAGHRVTVQPGNQVFTSGPTGPSENMRSLRVTGLRNGVEHTITVTATSTAGDGRAATATVTPRMTLNVFGAGDQNGDRRADLWATGFADAASNETWRLYTGAGAGRFGRTLTPVSVPAVYGGSPGSTTGRGPGSAWSAVTISGTSLEAPARPSGWWPLGSGFEVMRSVDAGSDLTSDGIADMVAVTRTGVLYLYPGKDDGYRGTLGRAVRLGSGWGSFHAVFSPGDFDGDRRADVIGVDSLGKLWLYPGNGRGGFGVRKQIGSGWGGFGSVLPLRDFSGDGKVDIGAITMDGKLRMYPGNGRGGFLTSSQIGTGWGMFL